MKQTRINVRGQWRHRPETSIEAARRLAALLASLAEIHPALSAWYKRTSSRPSHTPICVLPVTAESLDAFVRSGQALKDRTRAPWPERGFSVGAWNGALQAPSASFDLSIGAFDSQIAAFNNVEVSVHDVSDANSLVSFNCVNAIVRAIVSAMEPSVLDVTTRRWMLSVPQGTEFVCPAGGWMSYVEGNPTIDLPIGVEAEPLGSGRLLIATREDFTDSSPSHVESGYRLNQALAAIRKTENDLAPNVAPISP